MANLYKEKMNNAMYGESLDKTSIPSITALRMKRGWIFQKYNDPKNHSGNKRERQPKYFKVLECFSQYLGLNQL